MHSLLSVSDQHITQLFGEVVSRSPLWFNAGTGVLSVNTQARRLGCLLFLLGQVSRGRKLHSVLLRQAPDELKALAHNLEVNEYASGQLTAKASSIQHYLDAAHELHLLAKQGAMYTLTSRGQMIADVAASTSVNP